PFGSFARGGGTICAGRTNLSDSDVFICKRDRRRRRKQNSLPGGLDRFFAFTNGNKLVGLSLVGEPFHRPFETLRCVAGCTFIVRVWHSGFWHRTGNFGQW